MSIEKLRKKNAGETSGEDIRELNKHLNVCPPAQEWMDKNSHLSPKEMWDGYDNGLRMIEYCDAIGVNKHYISSALHRILKKPLKETADIVRGLIPYNVVREARRKYVAELVRELK
jgi:hypothetical protein